MDCEIEDNSPFHENNFFATSFDIHVKSTKWILVNEDCVVVYHCYSRVWKCFASIFDLNAVYQC